MDTIILSDNQKNLLRNTVAKGATDEELQMFMNVCTTYELDPFIKEIWFIKRPKKVKVNNIWDYKRLPDGGIDYTGAETIIMTSRDGYLKIAQRDADFDGIISFVVRENDVFEIDAEKYNVNHKFGAKRGKIIGAWCKVSHKKRKPVITWADFSEYYSESPIWKKYPSAMIQKVAECVALKRQFGISGITTKEEMAQEFAEYESFVNDSPLNNRPQNKPHNKPENKVQPPREALTFNPENEAEIMDAMEKEVIEYITDAQLNEIFALFKALNYNKIQMREVFTQVCGVEKPSRETTKDEAEFILQKLREIKINAVETIPEGEVE